MATRVILVRHGQSTYNADKRYQGASDHAILTARGHEMATQTGQFLRHTAIDAVYSSPLQRTQQTTQAILNALETTLAYQCHANLKEIAMPAWEGLSFQYVREHLAASYRCWKERPHEFQMSLAAPEAVSRGAVATLVKPAPNTADYCFPVVDLYAQAQEFWREALPRHTDETLLIVSHGGTIRALISTAIGMGCHAFHTLQQSNCGVSVLNFSPGWPAPAKLAAMNITHHLGESLPKLKEGKLGLRLLLVSTEDRDYLPQLMQLLQPSQIDFCLSSDRAAPLAQALLQHHHPDSTVYLRTAHDNFLATWHQTLQANSTRSDTLTTGLVVASPETIQRAIAQTLAMPTTPSVLGLKPGTLSIVQYPLNYHPVLQTLNFSGCL
jgi:phosphoserine phosphatase